MIMTLAFYAWPFERLYWAETSSGMQRKTFLIQLAKEFVETPVVTVLNINLFPFTC